jgi:hypothetical protein
MLPALLRISEQDRTPDFTIRAYGGDQVEIWFGIMSRKMAEVATNFFQSRLSCRIHL